VSLLTSWTPSTAGIAAAASWTWTSMGQSSDRVRCGATLARRHSTGRPRRTAPICVQSGSVPGILWAENVIGGAVGQDIAAGEFAELIDAIRSGVAYVNVHSSKFPGGETRGQFHGHER
jgi:hypothetical protein